MYTRYLIPLSLLACASIVSSTPVLAAGTCMTGNFVIEHKCSDNSCVTGGKTSVSRAGNTLYDFIQEGTPQNVSVASMIGNTIESIDGYCTGNNGSC